MPSPPSKASVLPPSFILKKSKILASISVPTESYDDLSPKGSIDEGIRDLIDEINEAEGWVTTSSCAGRVSVFLEGVKRKDVEHSVEGEVGSEDEDGERGMKLAAVGGKGGGGRWLFISHEKVNVESVSKGGMRSFLGLEDEGAVSDGARPFQHERLIHFKFEPMILHILTASPTHAQALLTAALSSGFRESGALNLLSSTPSSTSSSSTATPMVAVRSMGLGFSSIIGCHDSSTNKNISIVSEELLRGLMAIANERFLENTKRIERFREELRKVVSSKEIDGNKRLNADGEIWEDAESRRQRMREEGLKKARELKNNVSIKSEDGGDEIDEDLSLMLGG